MRVDYYPNELGAVCGSHLQGHQDASYDELVRLFGEPNSYGDGDKVRFEWIISFDVYDRDDGEPTFHTGTIYDWKEEDDTARYADTYDWHIGGHSKESYHLTSDLILNERFGNNSSFYNFRRV